MIRRLLCALGLHRWRWTWPVRSSAGGFTADLVCGRCGRTA